MLLAGPYGRIAYVPALALVLAGLALIATTPIVTPVVCSCGPAVGACTCPSGYVWHPLGPVLLAIGAIVAAIVFGVRSEARAVRRARSSLPPPV